MKKRNIVMAFVFIGIPVLILSYTFFHDFVYGYRVPTDALIVDSVILTDNTVYISAQIGYSSFAFAGYDAKIVGEQLQIIPRYCTISIFKRSGRLEVKYTTKGRSFEKIFIVGDSDNDKKQVWPTE